ncbi:hypothetical protein DFH09DRAFT_1330926 [Mycena vulgaris]|nr:hypothetical protein DFH09DRAFT_1330926 [Mycena vulgaris]
MLAPDPDGDVRSLFFMCVSCPLFLSLLSFPLCIGRRRLRLPASEGRGVHRRLRNPFLLSLTSPAFPLSPPPPLSRSFVLPRAPSFAFVLTHSHTNPLPPSLDLRLNREAQGCRTTRFACMADTGWIAGHTYIIYGPLLSGVTTLIFESTPVYPTPAHYWETVAAHKVTQFYSVPTAVRLLRRQTETGSIVVAPFPGAMPTKPGSATMPFFGQVPAILDAMTGEELTCPNVKDHARYLESYMKLYPGVFYTGDGAAHDADGYIWIKGRLDDVIRIGLPTGVAETAVVGTVEELTGQVVHAFVMLKPEFTYDTANEAALAKELVLEVCKVVGPFGVPKKIYVVPDLQTPSRKSMHRIMRKIVAGEGDQLGDLSTVAEPGIVELMKQKITVAESA